MRTPRRPLRRRDPQPASQATQEEYRQRWIQTRRALASYLSYVIGEELRESTGVPIESTPDTWNALRALGLDQRRYGELNRRWDERGREALIADLERISGAGRRRRRRRPS